MKVFIIVFTIGLVAGEIKNIGWWRNTVFYHLYSRSFIDSNNDGIGDLKGITSRLEHFVESGIGGIWLSPIYASPMTDYGYDISDFRDIDETYGTMQDFEELTRKAKKLRIKVILDFVPNHTSNKHYWFEQSCNGNGKYKDYYVWRKGKSNNTLPPSNFISEFTGSVWSYNPKRDLWYLHQFYDSQPDLNFTNPYVREEMEDILRFWLGKGIDGFRIDAVIYFYENDKLLDEPRSNLTDNDIFSFYLNNTRDDPRNYELIRNWRNLVDEWADTHDEDEKVIMTEAYTDLDKTVKFYNYGSHVPFNFFLITNVDKSSLPRDFKKTIENWMSRIPKNASANWVVGNHDWSRLATRYPGRVDQMTMLIMILPGIAITYYGEEIGMEDIKLDLMNIKNFRDPYRTPFQWDNMQNAGFSNASSTWLPVNQNYKSLNLAEQKKKQYSHYKLYQSLTKLRNESNTLKNGTLEVQVLNEEKVLAVIRRSLDGNVVLLLINFSNDTNQIVNLTTITEQFNKTINARVLMSSVGSGINWGSKVQIAGFQLPVKSTVIIEAK